MEDGVELRFGNDRDLKIYESSAKAFIQTSNGSPLKIASDSIDLLNEAGTESLAKFNADGAVSLYYDNSIALQTTTGSGILVNGNIELSGDSNIVLDTTLATSQTSGTIIKIDDQTVAPGEVYIRGESGGSGLWSRTTAGTEYLSGTGLLAWAIGTNAQDDGMLLNGVIYDLSHGFTIGLPIYIGTTTGTLTTTAPSGSGEVVRIVGYALDANHIYFCPDTTWVLLD